mgnify:CR=1 FL=1
MNSRAEIILDFWFNQTPAEKRFKRDETFDNEIKEKFLKDITGLLKVLDKQLKVGG